MQNENRTVSWNKPFSFRTKLELMFAAWRCLLRCDQVIANYASNEELGAEVVTVTFEKNV